MGDAGGQHVLLFDGHCGFCDRTVQHVLAHDERGTMRFAPLQGTWAAGVLARHPGLADVDSLVLVELGEDGGERVSVRSEAVRRVAAYLGGPHRVVRTLLAVVPRRLADWGYDLFARHRHRLFGEYDECVVPAPEVRARFLD